MKNVNESDINDPSTNFNVALFFIIKFNIRIIGKTFEKLQDFHFRML